MKFSINGTDYEIKTEYHHKQCDAYYKALEDGDVLAAHYLHIPPTHRSWESIQSEIRIIELMENYKAEMKRIEEMPSWAIEFELKHGIR